MTIYDTLTLNFLRTAFRLHEPTATAEFIGRDGTEEWLITWRPMDGNFGVYGATERQAWTKALKSRSS